LKKMKKVTKTFLICVVNELAKPYHGDHNGNKF